MILQTASRGSEELLDWEAQEKKRSLFPFHESISSPAHIICFVFFSQNEKFHFNAEGRKSIVFGACSTMCSHVCSIWCIRFPAQVLRQIIDDCTENGNFIEKR